MDETSHTDTSITLQKTFLYQSDDSIDSIAIYSDTLDIIGKHRMEWGVRAGGDDLPWGPCDGIMIIFNWELAQAGIGDSTLVWEVEGQ